MCSCKKGVHCFRPLSGVRHKDRIIFPGGHSAESPLLNAINSHRSHPEVIICKLASIMLHKKEHSRAQIDQSVFNLNLCSGPFQIYLVCTGGLETWTAEFWTGKDVFKFLLFSWAHLQQSMDTELFDIVTCPPFSGWDSQWLLWSEAHQACIVSVRPQVKRPLGFALQWCKEICARKKYIEIAVPIQAVFECFQQMLLKCEPWVSDPLKLCSKCGPFTLSEKMQICTGQSWIWIQEPWAGKNFVNFYSQFATVRKSFPIIHERRSHWLTVVIPLPRNAKRRGWRTYWLIWSVNFHRLMNSWFQINCSADIFVGFLFVTMIKIVNFVKWAVQGHVFGFIHCRQCISLHSSFTTLKQSCHHTKHSNNCQNESHASLKIARFTSKWSNLSWSCLIFNWMFCERPNLAWNHGTDWKNTSGLCTVDSLHAAFLRIRPNMAWTVHVFSAINPENKKKIHLKPEQH